MLLFMQLWLVLGVKLLEINSNWFSSYLYGEGSHYALQFRRLFDIIEIETGFQICLVYKYNVWTYACIETQRHISALGTEKVQRPLKYPEILGWSF